MNLNLDTLKEVISSVVDEVLEQNMEAQTMSEMRDEDKFDSLLGSIVYLRSDLEKISSLIEKAKQMPEGENKQKMLNMLKSKASGVLEMMSSIRNTIDAGLVDETIQEQSDQDIANAKKEAAKQKEEAADAETKVSELEADKASAEAKAAELKNTMMETFQIRRTRLLQIVEEEIKMAKDQGIL